MLHFNRKPDVSSIKLSKASRYCDLQSQKWRLSVHLAWFKPLSTAVTVTRIPRSTLNLQWQLWTAEEMRIFCYSKIFAPEKHKESIFFCNCFSTILKVVVSNKKPSYQINIIYKLTWKTNICPTQARRNVSFVFVRILVRLPFPSHWNENKKRLVSVKMELIILSLSNGTVSISVISCIKESLSHEKCIQLLGLDVTSTSLLRLTITLSLSPSYLAPYFQTFYS